MTRYEINLQDKPDWYATRVNPASKVSIISARFSLLSPSPPFLTPSRKVPVVVYGSPQIGPRAPSPESAKIAESLVLLEFIASLYPDSGLLPKDSVERAHAFSSTHSSPNSYRNTMRCSSAESRTRRTRYSRPQRRFRTCFRQGHSSNTLRSPMQPFCSSSHAGKLHFQNDHGKFAKGAGPRVYDELFRSERFARLQKYYANI